jgi:hypothetical protein
MNWRVSGSIGCTLPKHSNQYGTPKKPTSNNLREIGYVNGERERERERERGIEASDHSLQCIGSWVPLQITSWFANHQFTENLKMKI